MAEEQRDNSRAQTEIRIAYRTVGSFLSDYAINISRGGAFIQTENPLPKGTVVRLVFSLPGVPVLFDVSGKVKWIQKEFIDDQNPPGMGIEFVQMDELIRSRIEQFVKRNHDDVPDSIRCEKKPKPHIEMRKLSGSAPQRSQETQPNTPKPKSSAQDGEKTQPRAPSPELIAEDDEETQPKSPNPKLKTGSSKED